MTTFINIDLSGEIVYLSGRYSIYLLLQHMLIWRCLQHRNLLEKGTEKFHLMETVIDNIPLEFAHPTTAMALT